MVEVGARYRVGHEGVRLIFDDGVEMVVPARRTICFVREPRTIVGRLYRVADDGSLVFEAPELHAQTRERV